jgi:nitrous oxide reductase accessory protein NosL
MNYRPVAIHVLAAALLCMAAATALSQDDIKEHRKCVLCGMDRKAYGYSRMVIVYEDGSSAGVCSLHCAVLEMDSNKGRMVRSLLVADRDTRSLIDAEKATWVMGGTKRGVMTERPKWAFQTKAAAEAFIGKYGGQIVTWEEALAAAREDAAGERR